MFQIIVTNHEFEFCDVSITDEELEMSVKFLRCYETFDGHKKFSYNGFSFDHLKTYKDKKTVIKDFEKYKEWLINDGNFHCGNNPDIKEWRVTHNGRDDHFISDFYRITRKKDKIVIEYITYFIQSGDYHNVLTIK